MQAWRRIRLPARAIPNVAATCHKYDKLVYVKSLGGMFRCAGVT
jgi:hypothetical protein